MKGLAYFLNQYVFWYPLIMSMFWTIGGIIFYFRREKKEPIKLTSYPLVSILIPCYNEEKTIEETVMNLDSLNYENYEIIAINDGSCDNTYNILKELVEKYSRLRIIELKTNSGKANALYLGLIASKGEYIVGLDADAYLDKEALNYIIPHFVTPYYGERVGAVTGNPRVRNRSSLLAKIQLCEFSSIVSLIKRTQRILGKVMTVSGVVVAFRKKALIDCGLWDRDLITEDIGVTWKLQKRFWDVRYEPRALCYMLVPETISGLWKQRLRWSQGGMEVIIRHYNILFDKKYRRLVPILIEQILSIFWAISWTILFNIYLITSIRDHRFIFDFLWEGQYLSLICLIQFLVAMKLDKKYDEKLMKYYLWAIWYPILYWYMSSFVVVKALITIVFKNRNTQFATWDSPDRGL